MVEQRVKLPAEQSVQLEKFAQAAGLTIDEAVQRALATFLQLTPRVREELRYDLDDEALNREDYRLSLHAFREDWEDMPEDWATEAAEGESPCPTIAAK
jgi:hypothetical protein